MGNLSQEKRLRMLNFLNTIKDEHKDDDDVLKAIYEIENELASRKYGLVWEEHEENVDVQMRTHIPVFTEVKDKEIVADKDNPNFNFLLEGDNLHSLRLLEKTHSGKIDVIMIDPPYNRGKDDFSYNDDYIDVNDTFRHSKWLSFMDKRLRIARKLLNDSGVIFICIDENEFAQLKILCDDIFGEVNFMECIVWNKRVPKNDKGIGNIHEYILLYVKQQPEDKELKHKFRMPKDGLDEIFDFVLDMKNRNIPIPEAEERLKAFYNKKGYDRAITLYCQLDENYDIWGKINMCWPNGNSNGPDFDVKHPAINEPVKVPSRGWRWTEKTLFDTAGYDVQTATYTDVTKRYDGSFVCKGSDKRTGLWFASSLSTQPSSIKYLRDLDRMLFRSIYSTKSDGSISLENVLDEKDIFNYPKPPKMMYDLLDAALYNKRNAIVLDFFAGSGTTGEAVMQLRNYDNKEIQFILCTNNEIDVFQKIKFLHSKGYLLDYNPAKTINVKTVMSKLSSFIESHKELEELLEESLEVEKYGICQYVTYPRLKNVIQGYTAPNGSVYGTLKYNLKYYKTDYIDKLLEDVGNELLNYIKEMVQLEHGISIDNDKYFLLLSDDDADQMESEWDNCKNCKALYVSRNVLLTASQNKLFSSVDIKTIPDYYFESELREVGEIW